MATDNNKQPPSARDIFSNITVKQSMSSLNESPEVDQREQILNFTEMQRQLSRETREQAAQLSQTYQQIHNQRESISQTRMRKPSEVMVSKMQQNEEQLFIEE